MERLSAEDIRAADEETLAMAARSGDHLAFAELYRRYHPIVTAYVKPRVAGSEQDVVQNVFVKVLCGLPSYRGPRFFPWAYRICANVVTDEVRARGRRRGEQLVESEALEGHGGEATPEDELRARRLYGRLSKALDSLPDGQRTVFILARIDGLDYGEIADLLGVPVGTVKSRMFKAARALLDRGKDER